MKLDAGEIARRLAGRVDDVCRYLLPGGSVAGFEYRTADLTGGKGKSLGVHLAGEKRGIWSDFANSDSKGDLLDLWAAVRNIPLGEAIRESKQWLGITTFEAANRNGKNWAQPKFKGVVKFDKKPDSPVLKYLIEDRKLDRAVLSRYRVAEASDVEYGVGMSFPCFTRDGAKAVNATFIALNRPDGKKLTRQESGCAPALFGWQAFPKPSDYFKENELRSLLITEGQTDALTWATWGSIVPAVSIPSGTGNDSWIEFEYDNLEQFETIYLSFDEDDAGRAAVTAVAKRLGIHRCRIVRLPHKDANECLQKGMTSGDAAKLLMSAKYLSPEEIKKPIDFKQELEREMFPEPGNESVLGLNVPLFEGKLRFRPGEVTLWTGYTTHGKSTLLSQMILHAMVQGQRCAIGSFEIKPRQLLKKMVTASLLTDEPTREQFEQALEWINKNLWLYSVIGQINPKKLEELMIYSVMRHGIQQFVIDSLMKCQISPEDYEAQQNFMNMICKLAIDHDVHVHIVAHPRKDRDDLNVPTIMDVHGGQAVVAQPDNMIAVWRNRTKEKAVAEGSTKTDVMADTVCHIRKQRATGYEFKVNLRFNRLWSAFTADMDEEGRPIFHRFL